MPSPQDLLGSADARNRLRWRRERLIEELDRQLVAGVAILEKLASEPQSAEADVRRWSERNQTVLEQAFTQPAEANRYVTLGRPTSVVSPAASPQAAEQQRGDARVASFQRRYQFMQGLRGRADLFEEDPSVPGASGASTPGTGQRVFLVHGHNHALKHEVARVVAQLTGQDPVILHEQRDRGRTIIEKFEELATDAGAAVVLLTPDDEGRAVAHQGRDDGEEDSERATLQPRARQNVIYELGWFHGRLGRDNVVALLVGGVEQPSDIGGVLYVPVADADDGWKTKLGHELRAAGIDADLNNLR